LFNFFCIRKLNLRLPYKQWELEVNKLGRSGHTVTYEITMGDSGTMRPDWFNIEWWVDGIKQADKFFINDNSLY